MFLSLVSANEKVELMAPDLIRLLPAVPTLKRSFRLDNHSLLLSIHASSDILHAKANDGKYPHWFPFENLLEPSARIVKVIRYLSCIV